MDAERKKVCICYLITTVLISCFIYALISGNLQNSYALSRLREEVDEIAHVVLHSSPGGAGETKQLNEVIDTILKKRLSGIWDDVYSLKKQVKQLEHPCLSGGGGGGGGVDETKRLSARINYAAPELGAKIQSVVAEPARGSNVVKEMLQISFASNPPISMLQQSMEPGNCFAFRNSRAEVKIKLAKEIFIESFELEHISNSLSPTKETSSAPRHFDVYGVDKNDKEFLLGKFEYENLQDMRTQQYSVNTIVKSQYVIFRFESNHGHPEYTCVYRIAVFGKMN